MVQLRAHRFAYWRWRLRRWPGPAVENPIPGYTLLLPVPGDIPVFLELALKVCAEQLATNRIRTLVIPDRPSPAIEELVDKARASWVGDLDLVLLPRPERWFLPYMKSGSRNHGMQVVQGVARSTTTHVVLHDADLFMLEPALLESQFEACRARGLDCLGVSAVWDPWFGEKGLRLAATWELMASVGWLRRFPPYQQIGHDGELFGEQHTFDTTLYPQAVSPREKVDWADRAGDFVHFNYVISTYRHFQRHGPGFADDRFRLLLIALFVHLFSASPPPPGLPTLGELADGLGSDAAPVRYRAGTEIGASWRDFRGRLDRMLSADYIDRGPANRAVELLAAFDRYYSS